MKLGKCPVGSEVLIRGWVTQRSSDDGPVTVWIQGVGGTGEWALSTNTEVEVENAEDMLDQVMTEQEMMK